MDDKRERGIRPDRYSARIGNKPDFKDAETSWQMKLYSWGKNIFPRPTKPPVANPSNERVLVYSTDGGNVNPDRQMSKQEIRREIDNRIEFQRNRAGRKMQTRR